MPAFDEESVSDSDLAVAYEFFTGNEAIMGDDSEDAAVDTPTVLLPESFEGNDCGICHSADPKGISIIGSSLFEFTGNLDEFTTAIRDGIEDTLMPGYSAAEYSDSDIALTYSYFTGEEVDSSSQPDQEEPEIIAPVALSTNYIDNCKFCHEDTPGQNTIGPDLFTYAGDLNGFIVIAREGEDLMPAYNDMEITEKELEDAFLFFTTTAQEQVNSNTYCPSKPQ